MLLLPFQSVLALLWFVKLVMSKYSVDHAFWTSFKAIASFFSESRTIPIGVLPEMTLEEVDISEYKIFPI